MRQCTNRFILICACLAIGMTALAKPAAIDLEGFICVPVRAIADRVGLAITVDADTKAVTLTRGEKTLTVTPNRRKTGEVELVAPAFILDGALYVPKLDLFFRLGIDLEEDLKAKTLTVPGEDPLVIPITDFPRPKWVKDDTLAGLTPGDHLALAVALWGDPTDTSESDIPGTILYDFSADPTGGIFLQVTARGDEIVRVWTYITGDVSLAAIRPAAKKLSTGHGAMLATDDLPKLYGRSYDEYSHYSDDVIIENYHRGALTLICLDTFWGDVVTRTEMTLVKRGFPKKWLPMAGPRPSRN